MDKSLNGLDHLWEVTHRWLQRLIQKSKKFNNKNKNSSEGLSVWTQSYQLVSRLLTSLQMDFVGLNCSKGEIRYPRYKPYHVCKFQICQVLRWNWKWKTNVSQSTSRFPGPREKSERTHIYVRTRTHVRRSRGPYIVSKSFRSTDRVKGGIRRI